MTPEEKSAVYEKLYHKMFNANEDAMRILENAQQECEELYLQLTEDEEPQEE